MIHWLCVVVKTVYIANFVNTHAGFTTIILKLYILPSVYVFCIILAINSNNFLIQHKPNGFHSSDTVFYCWTGTGLYYLEQFMHTFTQFFRTYFFPISDKVDRNHHRNCISSSFCKLIKPNSTSYPVTTLTSCAQLCSPTSLLVKPVTTITSITTF
jgi:hypothetical protein